MKEAQPRWITLDEWSVTVEYVESDVDNDQADALREVVTDAIARWAASLQDSGGGTYRVTVSQ